MAFSFGQGSGGAGGFNFGNAATTSSGGFNLGSTTSTAPSGGLFGQGATFGGAPKSTGTGFTFGAAAPSFQSATSGSMPAPAFSFGGTSTAPTASTSTGFSFNTPSTQTGGSSLFGFGSSTAPAASTFSTPVGQGGGLFSFKTPGSTAATGTFATPQPAASNTSTGTGGFSFGGLAGTAASQPAASSAPSTAGAFTFGATAFQVPTTIASTPGGFNLGGAASTDFSLGRTSIPATSASIQLSSAPSQGAVPPSLFGKPAIATQVVTTTAPVPVVFGQATQASGSSTGPTAATLSMPQQAPKGPPNMFGASTLPTAAATPVFGTQTTSSATSTALPTGGTLFPLGKQPAGQTLAASSAAPLKIIPSSSSKASDGTAGTSIGFGVGGTATIGSKTSAPQFSNFSTVMPSIGSTAASTVGLGFPTVAPIKATTASATVSSTGLTFGQAKLDSTTVSGGSTLATSTSAEPAFKPTATTAAQLPTKGPAPTTESSQPSGIEGRKLTYKQLEDIVNKWLQELEEQERVFLNQANQVNTWDRLLIDNGEKITELHDEVERVKADQKRLDRELDFILSQQQELEDILKPLEDNIKKQESVQYMQHADIERERTYKLAENIDVELKRMMEDLREIIEHVNTSNLNNRDKDDPMAQIVKILNAHMDALQWGGSKFRPAWKKSRGSRTTNGESKERSREDDEIEF